MATKESPILHRGGHKYKDDGKALTYQPGEKVERKDQPETIQPPDVDRKRLRFLKHNNPVQFRELAEKTLIEIVRWMVAKNGGRPVDFFDVQRAGSYQIDVSLETIKRYVFTHSAPTAELTLTGKKVGVNADFVVDEEGDDEDEN